MTDANGNRIPANQHPRTLPELPVVAPQGGHAGALLGSLILLLLIGGIGATAVMVFAKVAAWAWS